MGWILVSTAFYIPLAVLFKHIYVSPKGVMKGVEEDSGFS